MLHVKANLLIYIPSCLVAQSHDSDISEDENLDETEEVQSSDDAGVCIDHYSKYT